MQKFYLLIASILLNLISIAQDGEFKVIKLSKEGIELPQYVKVDSADDSINVLVVDTNKLLDGTTLLLWTSDAAIVEYRAYIMWKGAVFIYGERGNRLNAQTASALRRCTEKDVKVFLAIDKIWIKESGGGNRVGNTQWNYLVKLKR